VLGTYTINNELVRGTSSTAVSRLLLKNEHGVPSQELAFVDQIFRRCVSLRCRHAKRAVGHRTA
jgi:hypothetical protein